MYIKDTIKFCYFFKNISSFVYNLKIIITLQLLHTHSQVMESALAMHNKSQVLMI